MLEEVRDRGPDDYTPTGLANFFDLDHFLHLEVSPSIDDLLNQGFIRETTYREAFSKVDLYEKFGHYLTLAAIANNQLYTVTPKGNGLVGLALDGGSKVEKKKGLEVLKPVMGF